MTRRFRHWLDSPEARAVASHKLSERHLRELRRGHLASGFKVFAPWAALRWSSQFLMGEAPPMPPSVERFKRRVEAQQQRERWKT